MKDSLGVIRRLSSNGLSTFGILKGAAKENKQKSSKASSEISDPTQ